MRKPLAYAAIVTLLILMGVLQCASASIYGRAGSVASLPAHISPAFGERVYTHIEHMYPSSWVEALLVRSALGNGDLRAAQTHLGRMDPSVSRSELGARLALARGDRAAAVRGFLQAVDVDALQLEVDRLRKAGKPGAAYGLENAIRARLLTTATHPDAVADSYWRSGVLASDLGMLQAGLTDYRAALGLAPFSEKYLLAAGTQSIQLHQYKNAKDFFERSVSVNPESADAYAGLGVVALRSGDRALAGDYERHSRMLDPSSQMLAALERDLH